MKHLFFISTYSNYEILLMKRELDGYLNAWKLRTTGACLVLFVLFWLPLFGIINLNTFSGPQTFKKSLEVFQGTFYQPLSQFQKTTITLPWHFPSSL